MIVYIHENRRGIYGVSEKHPFGLISKKQLNEVNPGEKWEAEIIRFIKDRKGNEIPIYKLKEKIYDCYIVEPFKKVVEAISWKHTDYIPFDKAIEMGLLEIKTEVIKKPKFIKNIKIFKYYINGELKKEEEKKFYDEEETKEILKEREKILKLFYEFKEKGKYNLYENDEIYRKVLNKVNELDKILNNLEKEAKKCIKKLEEMEIKIGWSAKIGLNTEKLIFEKKIDVGYLVKTSFTDYVQGTFGEHEVVITYYKYISREDFKEFTGISEEKLKELEEKVLNQGKDLAKKYIELKKEYERLVKPYNKLRKIIKEYEAYKYLKWEIEHIENNERYFLNGRHLDGLNDAIYYKSFKIIDNEELIKLCKKYGIKTLQGVTMLMFITFTTTKEFPEILDRALELGREFYKNAIEYLEKWYEEKILSKLSK